ncbi:MAG: alpha/beta fold hydrolase [Pseudomonadota bacterium]
MNFIEQQGLQTRPSHAWRLIDLIYETGQTPSKWPLLLEALTNTLPESTTNGTHTKHTMQQETLNHVLATHLQHALALNRFIGEQEGVLKSAEPLLATLTFPLLVIDSNYNLVYVGDHYSQIVHGSEYLKLADNTLLVNHPSYQNSFAQIFDGSSNVELLQLEQAEDTEGNRICVLPLPLSNNQTLALMAWFNPGQRSDASCGALASTYELTPAETELLYSLVDDLSYAELASERNVTENTVRTQIKQIFAKTQCHSRAELMQKVLCGPGLLNTLVSWQSDHFFETDLDQARLNQTVTTPNGNPLGFAEYGPKDGFPIILIHNISGSRLQIPVPEARFYEQGIRLIMPDRLGVGLSKAHAHFTIEDWTDAFGALLEHLDVQPLLMGTSMGGFYAMAAAERFPQHFSELCLVSPMTISPPEFDHLLKDDFKALISLFRDAPNVAELTLEIAARDGPARPLDYHIMGLPEADQALFKDQQFYQMSLAAMTENRRYGSMAMARDLALLTHTWPFEPGDIKLPTTIWHGVNDLISPLPAVEDLASSLPNATLYRVPHETHMMINRHWSTIIACLLRKDIARAALSTTQLLQTD